jgi:hypothetical protein
VGVVLCARDYVLAERRSILRSAPTPGYSGVVNHQLAATHEFIRLKEQFCLQRHGVPDLSGDEVVQSIGRRAQATG